MALAFAFVFGCGARSTLLDDLDFASESGSDGGTSTDGSTNPNCSDEIIASDPNGAIALALDGDTVFWGNADGLLETRDANGSRTLTSESPLTIGSIAVDDADVYYTIDDKLRSVPRNGGAPTTIATGVGYAFNLLFDGSSFFLLDRGSAVLDGRVLRVDADGSVHELLTNLDLPTGMAMDGDALYVAATAGFPADGGNDDGPLYRISKQTGEVDLLAENLYGPSSVSVDDTNVFIAAETEDDVGGDQASLFSVPKSGGTVARVNGFGTGLSLDAVVDDGSVYMTTYFASGLPADSKTAELWQIPIDDPAATTLSTTSDGSLYGYVRTSPTAIYWTINWTAGQRPADGASVRKKCK
jgi:hypothetical protein